MRYPFLVPDYPHFLHGGDYNPEQWLATPEILAEDLRLAKLAGVNSWSVGIFSWAALEPEEGCFTFDWLDGVLDKMATAGMKAVLATPSGAKPNWMAAKYPEIRRVQASGNREPQGGRHNHCFTSPVYREKVSLINTRLAERYQNHPASGTSPTNTAGSATARSAKTLSASGSRRNTAPWKSSIMPGGAPFGRTATPLGSR
jgi:beta-galactosidase